jgi:hypothetical protein
VSETKPKRKRVSRAQLVAYAERQAKRIGGYVVFVESERREADVAIIVPSTAVKRHG